MKAVFWLWVDANVSVTAQFFSSVLRFFAGRQEIFSQPCPADRGLCFGPSSYPKAGPGT